MKLGQTNNVCYFKLHGDGKDMVDIVDGDADIMLGGENHLYFEQCFVF